MKQPHLHRDAFALTGVLLECLESPAPNHRSVRAHVARTGLELLDAVTLASHRPSPALFDAARDALDLLHTQLDLARALRVLEAHDFVDLTGQLEAVGAGLTRYQDEVEER